jgi:hypothetical protein
MGKKVGNRRLSAGKMAGSGGDRYFGFQTRIAMTTATTTSISKRTGVRLPRSRRFIQAGGNKNLIMIGIL